MIDKKLSDLRGNDALCQLKSCHSASRGPSAISELLVSVDLSRTALSSSIYSCSFKAPSKRLITITVSHFCIIKGI